MHRDRRQQKRYLFFTVMFLGLIGIAGCDQMGSSLSMIRGYRPLAWISRGELLNHNSDYDTYHNKEVAVWGYIDFANSSLNARPKQQELFFNLKSRYENATGESIRVECLGAKEGYRDFFERLEKNGEFSREKIFVRGIMILHATPTTFQTRYRPVIEVNDSAAIRFESDFAQVEEANRIAK
jgi:hypothetical protein